VPFASAIISTDSTSFGTLDVWSAPVVTITLKNANSVLNTNDISVTYTLPTVMLLIKPLFLSGIIFVMFIGMLIVSRV
jgi:Ribophorin I